MEIERTKLKDDIAIEESQHVKLTLGQVRYFLQQLRRGKINDIKYRKLLINTLIYKVYIYDNGIAIYFNTQDKQIEKKIPRIEIDESSCLGKDALPDNCSLIIAIYIYNLVVLLDFFVKKFL